MRKRSGHLVCNNGNWSMRYFLKDKQRPSVALPTCRTEEEARTRMAVILEHVDALRALDQHELAQKIAKKTAVARDAVELAGVARAVRAIVLGEAKPKVELSRGMTFREFAEKWTSGELHELYPTRVKAKKTAHNDELLLGKHVYPVIGDVPISAITLDHGETVLNRMPSGLEEATVRHVAQVMSKAMHYAHFPARVIDAFPFPKGFLPKVTKRVAFPYLFPDEDEKVLACQDIGLVWRMLYGFLSREGLRVGEAKLLEWSDLDLRRGALNLDKTKTNDPRMWAMNDGVVEALRRYKKIAPESPWLFAQESGASIRSAARADDLREHVIAAGALRKQLHERTPERRPLRVHDLRATFVTISLAAGKTERWVADRTGHKSSDQIARYTRLARTHAELEAGELKSLVDAVPELAGVAA